MQNLDVISVNLWQILVSLCNLLIIFLILKRFLYQPVKRILTTRQAELDGQYAAAREAQDRAEADRRAWDEKMQTAETEAAQILKKATERADRRGEQILSDARGRADSIIREAEMQAALEQRKAQSEIKQEIVDVSEKIDTYETSIQPFEDCCTIFVAKHPVTKPNIDVIRRSEENLNEKIDELMKQAIETVEIIEVK